MLAINNESFYWYTFDIEHQLTNEYGEKWDKEIIDYAKDNYKSIPIVPRSITSREMNKNDVINTAVIDGIKVKSELNWLYKLYRHDFLELAKKATKQKLVCAANDLYGINLNVQIGEEMRYECHVDSNPVQGMLYITTHCPDDGGQLHVANNTNAKNINDVMDDCAIIQPAKGTLVFFDARRHSHFVNCLYGENNIRVAAAMNFYTPTSPESHRPTDLTKHLGLL